MDGKIGCIKSSLHMKIAFEAHTGTYQTYVLSGLSCEDMNINVFLNAHTFNYASGYSVLTAMYPALW